MVHIEVAWDRAEPMANPACRLHRGRSMSRAARFRIVLALLSSCAMLAMQWSPALADEGERSLSVRAVASGLDNPRGIAVG